VARADVRFGFWADIEACLRDVRFTHASVASVTRNVCETAASGLAPPYFRQSFDPRIRRAEGGNVGTIRGWFWGFVFVAMAVCFYWLGPSVYSIKYAVSADKIYVDPKPTDCDFWHAPVGKKGCHYQKVVIARDAKQVRAIRPGESDPNQRFDSVLISWVKKSD
jgi:hypothetical protein